MSFNGSSSRIFRVSFSYSTELSISTPSFFLYQEWLVVGHHKKRVGDIRLLSQQNLDTETSVFFDRGVLRVAMYLEQF